jgi:hypothetical protein
MMNTHTLALSMANHTHPKNRHTNQTDFSTQTLLSKLALIGFLIGCHESHEVFGRSFHGDASLQLPYEDARALVCFVLGVEQPLLLECLDQFLGTNKGDEPKCTECECHDFHRWFSLFLFHGHRLR